LNRAVFAEHVAKAISSWSGAESLVVALFGRWGSGKSSVKNMILDAFTDLPGASRPRILEFNPWHFSGQAQIFQAFFGELSKVFGRPDAERLSRRISARLRVYATSLAVARRITVAGSPFSLALVWTLGLLGVGFSFLPTGSLRPALQVLGGAAILVGAALHWGEKVLSGLSEHYKARSEAAEKTLEDFKASLASSLRSLDRLMVVVIDDLDRLSVDDLKLVFQLVKANADLPKLVFLLTFDRELVERMLADGLGDTGREYLGKIVQVGLDLPAINRPAVERFLAGELEKMIRFPSDQRRFDRVRWGNLFAVVLDAYFLSLRDVTRFLAGFEFHLGLVSHDDGLEVNFIDLFALEVLRAFEPAVYHQIYANREALMQEHWSSGTTEAKEAERRRLAELFVGKLESRRKEAAVEMIGDLFPMGAWIFGSNEVVGRGEQDWERDLRVAADRLFDRYFQLSVPADQVSQKDIDRVLASTADRIRFSSILKEFADDGRLTELLDRLDAYKAAIPLGHALSFVPPLLEVGDQLPAGRPGLTITPELRLARIIYFYLLQEGSREVRSAVFLDSVRASNGLFMPAYVAEWGQDANDATRALITEEARAQVRELIVGRIRDAARNGALTSSTMLGQLLGVWAKWGSVEAARSWVAEQLHDPSFILRLVGAFVGSSTSHGLKDRVARVRHHVNLDALAELASLDAVEEQLKAIKGQSGVDSVAIEAFERGMGKRRRGISQSSLAWIQDENEE